MSETETILVVEDEEHLARMLKLNLELVGFRCETAGSVADASRVMLTTRFDVIVLDWELPDLTGVEFAQRIRDAGDRTPIVMLTVRSSAEDKVSGLEAGADDYLTKPFEVAELVARVRAVLRRASWGHPHDSSRLSILTLGAATVDLDLRKVVRDDVECELTVLEFSLLQYFLDNPDRPIAREDLLRDVWKVSEGVTSRTVDNFVGRLRKHFEVDPASPRHFISVRGMGYRFSPKGG